MTKIQGFKITRTDGTTYGGYRWPLPMPGERITVHADPGCREFTEYECPQFAGDGLCVAKTAEGASSGGIGLASCVGLLLEFEPLWVLAEGPDKVKVRSVEVVGIFDVLKLIRSGLATDLQGANLRGAFGVGQ